MINGIQDFYYSVTDAKRAKSFYTEALGMKILFEHDYWIALDCFGVRIGLHPEDKAIPQCGRLDESRRHFQEYWS